MPAIFGVSFLLALLCGWHVVKTGRELYWIILLVMAPYLGSAIYILAIILPEQMTYRRRTGAVKMARSALDPEMDLRKAIEKADMSPTAANKKAVADELMARGRYDEALAHYDDAMSGPIHATDPALMSSKAHTLFLKRDYQGCVDTLEALRAANPGWRNAYAHLDYASAFEALGDTGRALDEFKALAIYFPGEEARVKYALLLEKTGQHDDADVIWREIRAAEKAAPPLYRRQQREWLDIARNRAPGG